MARRVEKTARLPSGLYVQRGRAVPFSKLSAAQQHAWRSHWSSKAAKTRTVARELPKVRRAIQKKIRTAAKTPRPKKTKGTPEWLKQDRAQARAEWKKKRDPTLGRVLWQNRERIREEFGLKLPDKFFYYH